MSFGELPAEVLSIIFEKYMKLEGHAEFLQNVVTVCRTWRDIGLSMCKIVDIAGPKDMTQRYLHELPLEGVKWGLPVTTELKMSKFRLDRRVSEMLFSGCPNLKSLTVSDCRVHETTFSFVARHCEKLESIAIDGVNQTGSTKVQNMLEPIFLKRGPKLKSVSLRTIFRNTRECEDLSVTIVSNCPNLEQLKLSNGYSCTPVFPTVKLRISCPKLRTLSIEGYILNEVCRRRQTDPFRNLEELELISVCDFDGFRKVIRSAEQLKQLTLKKFRVFYLDDIFKQLTIKSESLEKLHLIHVFIDQSDLHQLLRRLRHSLKEFTLVGKRLADKALLGLVRGNEKPPHKGYTNHEKEPALEVLNLSLPNMRASVLALVVQECKRLRTLDTSGCPDLPDVFRRRFDTVQEINLLRSRLPVARLMDYDSDSD